jgi:hypothetical protein
MQHARVEVFLFGELGHAGHKRVPERPIIGPFSEDAVNGRVVNGGFPIGVVWHRQALPLHPGVEDALLTAFAEIDIQSVPAKNCLKAACL